MALITFYEKPGCINNARQKKLLRQSGHRLIVMDLLQFAWAPGLLRPFFGDLPVADWFNRSSPRVKSGEVVPEDLDAGVALALMVEDPLLIRRPLMQSGAHHLCGFDNSVVDAVFGLAGADMRQDLQGCTQHDPCAAPTVRR